MKQLLTAIACTTLFVACSTDQQTTVDPTSAGNMGAAGSGSVTLPSDRVVVSNPPPPRIIVTNPPPVDVTTDTEPAP